MRRDERVFCIGEDIGIPGGWGGAFTVTLGWRRSFRDRMIDTPISEAGFFGVALGAAMMGMRPIADVQYGDFLFCAMDQMVNQVAKMRYMSGGKLTVPHGDARAGGGHRPRRPARADPGAVLPAAAGDQDRLPGHGLRREGAA